MLPDQSLSQRLARLRSSGLVTFRWHAQTLPYRIANPDTGRVLAVPRDVYCPELEIHVHADHRPPAEENGMRYLKIPLDAL